MASVVISAEACYLVISRLERVIHDVFAKHSRACTFTCLSSTNNDSNLESVQYTRNTA